MLPPATLALMGTGAGLLAAPLGHEGGSWGSLVGNPYNLL